MAMNFAPSFFDVQLRFADKVAQVCTMSMEEAVFSCTNIYLQLIDRSFDPAHPVWQAYLEGLRKAQDRAEWTAEFYRMRRDASTSSMPPSGCFSYGYLAEERVVRIHFMNRDLSGYGPLSRVRMPVRLDELRALFAEVRTQHPEALTVRGNSWLYNVDAYKRLFPPQYTQEMKTGEEELQFLARWGQLVQRDGQVRKDLAASFLDCVDRQETWEGLNACFRYQVWSPQCAITHFYEWYRL